MSNTPDRTKDSGVTIYVHRRRIIRKGKIIWGWQAGFQRSGGATSETRQGAIDYQLGVAARYGMIVTNIEDLR